MKNLKKTLAALLALTLILMLAVAAVAETAKTPEAMPTLQDYLGKWEAAAMYWPDANTYASSWDNGIVMVAIIEPDKLCLYGAKAGVPMTPINAQVDMVIDGDGHLTCTDAQGTVTVFWLEKGQLAIVAPEAWNPEATEMWLLFDKRAEYVQYGTSASVAEYDPASEEPLNDYMNLRDESGVSEAWETALAALNGGPGEEHKEKEIVLAAQEALNALGYDCGKPDGIMGKNTARGITGYQTDNGLNVTGTVTDELLIYLGLN